MEKLTRYGRYACLVLFIFIIYSCSGLFLHEVGSKGVYHRVKSGETLSAIATAYQVDPQSIAEINNITDSSLIEKDRVIFIPNAEKIIEEIQIIPGSDRPPVKIVESDQAIEKRKAPVAGSKKIPERVSAGEKRPKPVSEGVIKEEDLGFSKDSKEVLISKNHSEKAEITDKTPGSEKAAVEKEKQQQLRFNKSLFIWPVEGKVTSSFGKQPNGMFFSYIKITSPKETAVLAARDGVVEHSERLKFFGETVIVKHADDYATVYANLAVRAVDLKSRLKKGDRIGFIGKVSGSEEIYLYFEIRHKNKARNPLFFLP